MCWAKVCAWENLVRWCHLSWSASFTLFKGHTLTYVCNHIGDKCEVCQIFACKNCHLCPLQLDVNCVTVWDWEPRSLPMDRFFLFVFCFFDRCTFKNHLTLNLGQKIICLVPFYLFLKIFFVYCALGSSKHFLTSNVFY